MSRLPHTAIALGMALTTLAGCAGSTPTATQAPSGTDSADALAPLGMVVREGGIVESAIGRGLLTLDAASMTATWESLPLRIGQDNDAVYALSVNEFLKPVDASIRAFRRTADGFEIDYEFTHPFKSSEISNRADLGFSGMFMLGVTPLSLTNYTWFKDDTDLITDPRWITNADGYYQPKGLVDTSGIPGNAFPYQLLIDERGTGNRKDAVTGSAISNGGLPTGNFVAPDGWQTGESKSWTGYGVIHQGQKIRNTFAVNGEQLSGVGSLPIITVLLAKYADPKSATPGFEHRLPASPPDVVGDFGYRMPHGALDVPEAEFIGATNGWLPNVESSNTLGFHIVDWDARATETTEPSLRTDPDATKVMPGESGLPELALCIPDILGDRTTVLVIPEGPTDDDTAYGGDAGVDSGAPGDELFYAATVEKPAGSGQVEGDYLAWLRVTDVEVATQDDYLVALNDDLTPITGEFPLPVTYHPFNVRVGGNCAPPQGVGWATEFGDPDGLDIDLYAVTVDAQGNSYSFGNFSGDIDLGGGLLTSAGQSDWFLVKHTALGAFIWGKTFGGARSEAGRALAVNGAGEIWLGGSHAGPVDLGGGLLTPGGSYGMLVAKVDQNGEHVFSASYGETGFSWLTGLSYSGIGALNITGYSDGTVSFGAGTATSAGSEDIVVGRISEAGTGEWTRMFGGTTADRGLSISGDSSGGLYIGGSFTGTANLGAASPTSAGDTDAFLLKLDDEDGAPLWVRDFGGPGPDTTSRVRTDFAGNYVVVAGQYEEGINLGGGNLPGQGTDKAVFLGQFDTAGAHRWSQGFVDTSANLDLRDLAVHPDGTLQIAGSFFDSVNFGGAARFGNGSSAGFIARFAQNGSWIADGQIGGAGGDEVRALSFQPDNKIIYAGYADWQVDMNPDCNVASFTFDPDGAFFIARTATDLGW